MDNIGMDGPGNGEGAGRGRGNDEGPGYDPGAPAGSNEACGCRRRLRNLKELAPKHWKDPLYLSKVALATGDTSWISGHPDDFNRYL